MSWPGERTRHINAAKKGQITRKRREAIKKRHRNQAIRDIKELALRRGVPLYANIRDVEKGVKATKILLENR